MAKINLDSNKSKLSDIKRNLDSKKSETEALENNKQELIDAITDVQGSNLDEKTAELVEQDLNNALEENAERGRELSEEMNEDISAIEEMKQETQEAIESNTSESGKLKQKQAILDKVGLGKGIETAISELDDNMSDLNDFNESLIETGKEFDDTARRLSAL